MTTECSSSQQLIEQCQGLVRSLAQSIHRKLPPQTDFEDLVAYGQVGLAEAARSFDPSRGSQFSTFAYYRIRGAIYDGLSKMAWFSRSQYKQIRTEQAANDVLRLECEDEAQPTGAESPDTKPTDEQADVRWLRNVTRALAVVHLVSGEQKEDGESGVVLADDSTPTAAAAVMGEEIRQRLHELIDSLPQEPRTLIRATYFEGLTLREAGERLGISKSWASRLHAKTLQRLAQSLRRLGVAP